LSYYLPGWEFGEVEDSSHLRSPMPYMGTSTFSPKNSLRKRVRYWVLCRGYWVCPTL